VSERERDDNEDAAWLVARERGQPGPAVSDATAARYARLQSLITDLPALPAGVTPRAGWQQDVLASIDAAEAEPDAPSNLAPVPSIDSAAPKRTSTRRRRWAAATASFAVAAVVVILLAGYLDRGGPDGPAVESIVAFEVEPADRPHRGSDPSAGDTLIVR